MDDQFFSKELWKISNAIVAFFVVQTISFTVLCTNRDFRNALSHQTLSQTVILVLLTAVTVAGCFVIHWCTSRMQDLMRSEKAAEETRLLELRIVNRAGWARILIVCLLLIPALLALATVNRP